MSAREIKELARINGRGHARGWHAQQLQTKAARDGRSMADAFLESIENASAFNVPAEAVQIRRGRVLYRFADGSEAEFLHQAR
jgi:hypothetical protein